MQIPFSRYCTSVHPFSTVKRINFMYTYEHLDMCYIYKVVGRCVKLN